MRMSAMMNKALIGTAIAIFVAGCASTPGVEKDAAGSDKLGVTQVGHNQNAQLVFCETNRCPERTPKYLPPPPPAPVAKAPVPAPVVKAPEPVAPLHFKVHFRWGWFRLDTAGREEIQALLDAVKNTPHKQIVVAGRTDPTGGLKANKKLALKRANTVKAALVMAGIPADAITADAQLPCCDGDKRAATGVMRELRRTDIDITIKTK